MFEKKFLKDKDLEFLEECSNEDLKVLADLLVYDKDDNPRYSETLSRTRLYKESYPNQLQNGQRLHMNFNSMAGIVLLISFGDMEYHTVRF